MCVMVEYEERGWPIVSKDNQKVPTTKVVVISTPHMKRTGALALLCRKEVYRASYELWDNPCVWMG